MQNGKHAAIEVPSAMKLTLRPTKAPDRDETNTGEYAYKELQAYATSAEKGYDQEYDTDYDTSEGTIEIKGDFTFKKNEDSNKILYRLIAILLDRAKCAGTLKNTFVTDVFNGKYKFDCKEHPIWKSQNAKFGGEKLGAVEKIFGNLKEENPLKKAFDQFNTLVFKTLESSNSLDRMQTEDLIEAFVGYDVECQTVLQFLGRGKIRKDEKYKKLFEKLTPNSEEAPE